MKRCFLCGKYGATEREVWADIPGYDGAYIVSTNGRIMSLRGTPRIMIAHDNGHGYAYITLSKNGKKRTITFTGLWQMLFASILMVAIMLITLTT